MTIPAISSSTMFGSNGFGIGANGQAGLFQSMFGDILSMLGMSNGLGEGADFSTLLGASTTASGAETAEGEMTAYLRR